MKCLKCGEDLDTGLNCYKCGYLGIKKIELEPTIAEKLLWLAENFNVHIQDDCGLEVTIENRKNGRWAGYFVGSEYETKTLAEAINKVYKWAKKELKEILEEVKMREKGGSMNYV